MSDKLDVIDRKILKLLQKNCRRSIAELAADVGLSKSACHRRIQQLESCGAIEGYVAVLNAERLGWPIQFVVDVTLNSQSEEILLNFERSIRLMPEVLECQLMTGEKDYVLRVAAQSVSDFEQFHHRLAGLPAVASVASSLALRTVKAWTGVNLDYR